MTIKINFMSKKFEIEKLKKIYFILVFVKTKYLENLVKIDIITR